MAPTLTYLHIPIPLPCHVLKILFSSSKKLHLCPEESPLVHLVHLVHMPHRIHIM